MSQESAPEPPKALRSGRLPGGWTTRPCRRGCAFRRYRRLPVGPAARGGGGGLVEAGRPVRRRCKRRERFPSCLPEQTRCRLTPMRHVRLRVVLAGFVAGCARVAEPGVTSVEPP